MSTSNKASSKKAPVVTAQAPVVTPAVETTTTVVVAVKAPSKASLAKPMLQAALEVRQAEIDGNVPMDQRKYKTNKDFRMGICTEIHEKLGVSMASAGSMYNSFKIEVEKANPNVGLGRDPKQVKAPKKEKVVVVTAPATTETQQTASA